MDDSRTFPSISAVVLCFNHGHYLPRALQALIDQSYPALEIIVLDDCSTDNSLEVAEGFAATNPVIRVLRNEVNRGIHDSAQRACAEARGDFIYFGGADDFVLPGLFEKCATLLAANPEARICVANFRLLHEDQGGLLTDTPPALRLSTQPVFLDPGEFALRLRSTPAALLGTQIWPTHALLEMSYCQEGLEWLHDWFVTHVLAFRHGLCFIPEPLMVFRVSAGSYSGKRSRDPRAQRRVLQHMVALLMSMPLADVAPWFRESRLLAVFGWPLLVAVATRRDLWPYAPSLPLAKCCWVTFKQLAIGFVPSFLLLLYRRLFGRSTDLVDAAAFGHQEVGNP